MFRALVEINVSSNAKNKDAENTTRSSSDATPIVPVQVTRRLQSVSVNNDSESKKKYWMHIT